MSDNTGKLIRDQLWFDGGFAMIPNAWARDSLISNQARGLLVQLASHEAGFEITITALMSAALNGRDAIRAQVGELERAGYLKRYRTRIKGRIVGIEWRLCDPHAPVDKHGTPIAALSELAPIAAKKPRSEPAPEKPTLENPTLENPAPENPTTIEDHLQEDLNPSTGSSADVSTERAVDNFEQPGSICPGRSGGKPHEFNGLSLRCEHCGERPAAYDAATDLVRGERELVHA